jgi:hypothetical protein
MRNLLKYSLAFLVACCAIAAQAAQQPAGPDQQLVAPIALYPDSLVAQILAAATNPTEIVQASRWMHQNPGLTGPALAGAVDSQPWDPSVKALTQFPSILDNLSTNLSWTSALGDAYVNGPQGLLDAVQQLRQQAQAAGYLGSTSQQTVSTQGQAIVIEPANPQVVYVPAYDPWLAYGTPIAAYPGWVGVPGTFYDGPDLYFGAGISLGLLGGFAWGAHHWGLDWRHREAIYDHSAYVSHSPTFLHHHAADRAPAFHDGGHDRAPDFRPHVGASAFSGFGHGGVVRGYADHGRASFGGGFHAGGGGFHGDGGGGSHGGGGHR